MSSVYRLARAGIALAGRTPSRLRHALASTATTATYLGWRDKRLATQENMATVLGLPATDRRVRRTALASWANYGRTAGYLAYLPHLDMEDVDARIWDLTAGTTWLECLRSAMTPGNGLIVATGHFGSWDLAGAVAARHVPLSAIADTFNDPQLDTLLQGHRRDRGVHIIPASGAVRRATQELVAGRAVAIVIDRPVTRQRGVEVTFFGHRTYVPTGAAALAVRTGASIMPGYFWYAPHGHYYLRDNVSARVNAVAYFRVVDPPKAVTEVENFTVATSQIAQTTLRSVLGGVDLDTLLAERDKLNDSLREIVDEQTEPWGIKVTTVEIKDVEIPEATQRAMARPAEAERERQAKVIGAEGEYQAAEKLSDAAQILDRSPAAIQLRYLQTLVEIGSEQNSTVVFPLPIDVVQSFLKQGTIPGAPDAHGPR